MSPVTWRSWRSSPRASSRDASSWASRRFGFVEGDGGNGGKREQGFLSAGLESRRRLHVFGVNPSCPWFPENSSASVGGKVRALLVEGRHTRARQGVRHRGVAHSESTQRN